MMANRREPIKNTCPAINDVISRLDYIQNWCKDISHYCELAESEMEDLRTANDTLRSWGNEEADKVDELEDTITELEQKISELENDVNNLELDINRLQEELDNK